LKGICQILRYDRSKPHTCFIEIQVFLLNTKWFLLFQMHHITAYETILNCSNLLLQSHLDVRDK
jgi:hypothetical protein